MGRQRKVDRDRIVAAAVRVADDGGLARVSMRSVAREAGIEAMSLYHHVRGKDDLLDALADWPFTQIETPEAAANWRDALAAKAASARAVLVRHPWAIGLTESRRMPGPALLRHHDGVLGCLFSNGFSARLATHAFSVVDAYAFGFALSEANLPMTAGESAAEYAAALELPAAAYPHIARVRAAELTGGDFDYADEFTYGLELILGGLAGRLAQEQ